MKKLSAAILLVALGASVQAQSASLQSLADRLEKDLSVTPQPWPLGWPGSSALTPTAFGGTRGMIGFGVGFQPTTRFNRDRHDGVCGVIVPVGDPVNSVGVDILGTLTDMDHLSDRGSFDFVIHKRFQNSAVAIGTERFAEWGHSDSDKSYYLVGSHVFHLQESSLAPLSRLTVSAGIGSGRFRREADVFSDRKTVGVFGSASINVVREASFFAEWSGQDLDLGISVSPFHNLPLVLTAAAVDMTGSAGDGTRATFGAGYVLRFH